MTTELLNNTASAKACAQDAFLAVPILAQETAKAQAGVRENRPFRVAHFILQIVGLVVRQLVHALVMGVRRNPICRDSSASLRPRHYNNSVLGPSR